ncbi:MAG: hypothetical protein AAF514_04785, partial [Verrucomicrobiota bacterium]
MGAIGSGSEPKKRSAFHPWRLLPRLAFYYLAYALLAFFFQSRLIFPGQSHEAIRPYEETFPGGRTFSLTTEKAMVPAVFVPGKDKTRTTSPVLIVAHGNFELIDHWQPLVENFTDAGLAVLLVEYPGYGQATGVPVQKNLT